MPAASTLRYRLVPVSWARIEPRRGEYDEVELAERSVAVRELRKSGEEPIVILHAGALPDWMISRHGWLHPDAMAGWGCYVDRVAQKLGVHVAYWLPIHGMLAEADWYEGERKAVVRSLIEAHATAYLHLKRSQGFGGKPPEIGMVESDSGRSGSTGFRGFSRISPVAIARVLATGKWSPPLGFFGELSNGTPALDFVALEAGSSSGEWPVGTIEVG